jgi:hypothetical protein
MEVRRAARSVALVVAAVVLAAGAAGAHHGWSSYDEDRRVTVTGPVEEASFEHPHVTLRVRADDRVWLVVLPPPTRAATLGLSAQVLRPGVRVSAEGHPHRREPGEMRAVRLVVGERSFRLR